MDAVPTCAPAQGHNVEEVRTIGGELLGYHCVCGNTMPLNALCEMCQQRKSARRIRRQEKLCLKCAGIHPCARAAVGCAEKAMRKGQRYCSISCQILGAKEARATRRAALEAEQREMWANGIALCPCGSKATATAKCDDCGRCFGTCRRCTSKKSADKVARALASHEKTHKKAEGTHAGG